MRRRRFLGALGTAGVAGLTGCTGGPSGSGGGSDGGGNSEPWDLPDHPALTALDAEPALGPDPGEAPGLVVGFEDPACINCRRFEEGTLPELKSELVANDRLTFVYRVFPITYPWGKPATQALEATYAAAREKGAGRDAPAFWSLKDHYYAEQDAFSTDNVLDMTETYLASETDLDATAVVEAARQERHDDRVQADLDAGNEAGVQLTPTFYLFRDGAFETEIRGAQGYDVFATALGF